jgi:hypothetical protein
MKRLLILAFVVLSSCNDGNLEYIGQDIIDGKVSATEKGVHFSRGSGTYPMIWVQTPTETRAVEIPFQYEGKWKVGDSCLLIIEKYKEIPEKK